MVLLNFINCPQHAFVTTVLVMHELPMTQCGGVYKVSGAAGFSHCVVGSESLCKVQLEIQRVEDKPLWQTKRFQVWQLEPQTKTNCLSTTFSQSSEGRFFLSWFNRVLPDLTDMVRVFTVCCKLLPQDYTNKHSSTLRHDTDLLSESIFPLNWRQAFAICCSELKQALKQYREKRDFS